MTFIILAHKHGETPTFRTAALLTIVGGVLFFAHALMFLFAMAVGGVLQLMPRRRFADVLKNVLPFGLLALLCLIYMKLSPGSAAGPNDIFRWVWGKDLLRRGKVLLFFPQGAPRTDWALALFGPLALTTPWFLKLPFKGWANSIPIIVLLAWYVTVPSSGWETGAFAERFAVFLLPFYALLFSPTRVTSNSTALTPRWLVFPLLAWGFLAVHIQSLVAFARETRSYDEVVAAMMPGERVLGVILDSSSAAVTNPSVYLQFFAWTQAQSGMLVDFNFAHFRHAVVRYRQGAEPQLPSISSDASKLEWQGEPPATYRYILVRHSAPLAPDFLSLGDCNPIPRASAGPWSVFEIGGCDRF